MGSWDKFLHLGDISLILAAAAGITAWLLAARAWRMAFWWSLLFAAGIGLVGASKIAYIAWGQALPGLDFKAASGHAAGITAIAPLLLYLLARHRGGALRTTAIAAGLALGALMGVLLVAGDEHSVAEALAGWALGAVVSLGGIWMAADLPPQRPAHGLLCSALAFAAAAAVTHSFPFGYLMYRTARILSGNTVPFPWG
ncbi:MAG: membrane-associated phospholipid phosphatase [Pseudomonadota bacterium]